MKIFQTNSLYDSARFIRRNTETSQAAERVQNQTDQTSESADDGKTESAMKMVEANDMPNTATAENDAADSLVLDGIDNNGEGENPKVENKHFKAFENIAQMSDNAPFHKGISSIFRNTFNIKPGEKKQVPIRGEAYNISINADGTVFNCNGNAVDWSDPQNIKVMDKTFKIPDEKVALSRALVEFVNSNL